MTLKFCDKDDQECDIRRAYLLYFWIETLVEKTFQRQQDGGNMELGIIPTLGATAFEQNMD